MAQGYFGQSPFYLPLRISDWNLQWRGAWTCITQRCIVLMFLDSWGSCVKFYLQSKTLHVLIFVCYWSTTMKLEIAFKIVLPHFIFTFKKRNLTVPKYPCDWYIQLHENHKNQQSVVRIYYIPMPSNPKDPMRLASFHYLLNHLFSNQSKLHELGDKRQS